MSKRTTRTQIIDRRKSIMNHLDGINVDLFRICDLAKMNSPLINKTIPTVVASIEILQRLIMKLWQDL